MTDGMEHVDYDQVLLSAGLGLTADTLAAAGHALLKIDPRCRPRDAVDLLLLYLAEDISPAQRKTIVAAILAERRLYRDHPAMLCSEKGIKAHLKKRTGQTVGRTQLYEMVKKRFPVPPKEPNKRQRWLVSEEDVDDWIFSVWHPRLRLAAHGEFTRGCRFVHTAAAIKLRAATDVAAALLKADPVGERIAASALEASDKLAKALDMAAPRYRPRIVTNEGRQS